MNKLKALLVMGLLSLSSASFAVSGDFPGPTSTVGSQGTIELTAFDQFYNVGGFFDPNNNGSEFYDLIITEGSVLTITDGADATDTSADDVTINIYNTAIGGILSGLEHTGLNTLAAALTNGVHYYIEFTGALGDSYNADVAAVPVPAAGILFASALLGAGALGRRKKKAKASVVGAFARAS